MKKLLGVDTLYLNSQKRLKNLMNHYKNNKKKSRGTSQQPWIVYTKNFNNMKKEIYTILNITKNLDQELIQEKKSYVEIVK